MRKKLILLIAVVFLSMTGLAQSATNELHGAVGITYDSKYIWRGFDIYGDKSAIHPFIDLDLYNTGFGLNLTGHRANSDKYENSERWDYSLYYRGIAYEEQPYATQYMFVYRYYNYPDNSSHSTSPINTATGFLSSTDLQEMHALFSWPNILPVEGLVPRYCIVKLWPSNSGSVVGANSPSGGTASGFAHIFMLDYALPVTCPFSGQNRTLNFHSEVVYNDGVGPNGANVDQDWSNLVVGVGTDFDLGSNLTFTPGVYHQVTMDKSVNPDKDETWASLTLSYKF